MTGRFFLTDKKNPPVWNENRTQAVKRIDDKVKRLPCLHIRYPYEFTMAETNALT